MNSLGDEIFAGFISKIEHWKATAIETEHLGQNITLRNTETEKVLLVCRAIFFGPNCLTLGEGRNTTTLTPQDSLLFLSSKQASQFRWTGPTPTCNLELEGEEQFCQNLVKIISQLGITITENKPYNRSAQVIKVGSAGILCDDRK